MHHYGIQIEKLDDYIGSPAKQKTAWGEHTLITAVPEYSLQRMSVNAGKAVKLKIEAGTEAVVFIEEGDISYKKEKNSRNKVLLLPAGEHKLRAAQKSCIYVFTGNAKSSKFKKTSTFDYRDKYWGNIQTIINKEYTGKRLFFKRGKNSSLHFHCAKKEHYYIHSGELRVRLRAGRGEDKYFEIKSGETLFIPPGLIHQDQGIEDTVIIEISTHDEDSDSFIVEDGEKHRMPVPYKIEAVKAGVKKICFDIDGCLCAQTDGDYKKAAAIPEAVNLVNSFYKEGFHIILHTARFMNRNNGNVAAAIKDGYQLTQNQLNSWGVLYHELVFGKPSADVIIDDRAVFFKPNWKEIEKNIRAHFKTIPMRATNQNQEGQGVARKV